MVGMFRLGVIVLSGAATLLYKRRIIGNKIQRTDFSIICKSSRMTLNKGRKLYMN